MIQGSINQLLSMAAMAQRLSPEFEANQARVQTKRDIKNLRAQAKVMKESTQGPEGKPLGLEAQVELAEKVQQAGQKSFELDPSVKKFNALEDTRELIDTAKGALDMRAKAKAESDKALRDKQEEKRKVREALLANEYAQRPIKRGGIKHEYK